MEVSKPITKSARIWSFDGGGPSVISQLLIVNEIMYQIQWALELEEVPRPCDYADLMVGTGLGAITVILLARLCLTAEEALTHLIELGRYVFLEPNTSATISQFDIERLKNAILKILKRYGLDENTKMIEDVILNGQTYAAITTTPASNLSTCRLFRTYRIPSPEYNSTIVESILATMAFPSWFPPVEIGLSYSKEKLVGGSVGFNNPTERALEEARRVFGAEQRVSVVISLGPGQRPPRALNDSMIEGLEEALSFVALDEGATAERLAKRFDGSSFYYRLSVDIGMETTKITQWNEDQLGEISGHTKTYTEKISSTLATVVELLLNKEGTATLRHLTQVNTKPTSGKPVPRLSPYYVLRDDVYNAMEQRLIQDHWDTQRLFVIFGMGGAGKTQSMSFFEKRNRKRYKYIFFIDASSVASIKADLQSAVRSLGGTHSQGTFEDALKFLSLSSNQDWLVIFDNADDPTIPLVDYLPSCDHGTLVITGRNPDLIILAPNSYWHMKGMTDADAMKVLFRAAHCQDASGDEEHESAVELCKVLGGLPLALVHVGFYCHTSKVSFTQYLQRFKEHRAILMRMEPTLQLDGYGYSTYASIGLSYSLLDKSALSLLHLLVFFHPSTIHLDILRIAAKYQFEEHSEWECLERDGLYCKRLKILRQILTPNGEWNEVHVDRLLHQLQAFSLVSLSVSNGCVTLTIHPLVQSCVQDTLSPAECDCYLHMAVYTLGSCGRSKEFAIFQYLTAHILEIESLGVELHVNDIAAFAHILIYTGSYEDSMTKWEMVHGECQRIQGHEHWSTLRASYWRAECIYRLCRYKEAEEILRDVAVAQESVFGEGHDRTLDSYERLGWVLTGQGKIKEAEMIFKRVLALVEDNYGNEHRRTLRIQLALADNLYKQSNYSEAESILRRSLPIMNNVLGEDDNVTLTASNNLSLALQNQGKWTEAETILENLVIVSNKVYGRGHPYTLVTLFNLSLCLQDRGDWTEAERIQTEVLEIQERTLGRNHPNTIKTRNALNETFEAIGKSSYMEGLPDQPKPTPRLRRFIRMADEKLISLLFLFLLYFVGRGIVMC